MSPEVAGAAGARRICRVGGLLRPNSGLFRLGKMDSSRLSGFLKQPDHRMDGRTCPACSMTPGGCLSDVKKRPLIGAARPSDLSNRAV